MLGSDKSDPLFDPMRRRAVRTDDRAMTETLDRRPDAAPGRPGIVPLRPLMPGEILDGAVTAMRAHPGIMLGLSAVIVVCGQLVAIPLDFLYLRLLSDLVGSSTTLGDGSLINSLSAFRPGTLISFLTDAVLAGLLTVTVSRAVLGRPVDVGEVWRIARPRLFWLVCLSFVAFLGAFGPMFAAIAVGALLISGGAGVAGGFLLFFGVAGGLVWALYHWVSWMLSGAALMLEGQKIVPALRRSAVLVKGGWWRVLGIYLLAMLVTLLVTGILQILQQTVFGNNVVPVTDNGDGTVTAHQITLAGVLINSAFTTAIQAVTGPFIAAVTALQYIDRRMRREGLDIQLARSAAATPGGAGSEQARRFGS
jgi:hypothetical protein